MASSERVVRALFPAGKPAYFSELAQGMEASLAARNELVGVRLVAHIPDQAVSRGVKVVAAGAEEGVEGDRGEVSALCQEAGRELWARVPMSRDSFTISRPILVGVVRMGRIAPLSMKGGYGCL